MFVRSLPNVGHRARGGVFGETVSLPNLPSRCGLFIHCEGAYSSSFQVFFRGNFPLGSCRSVASMVRGDFRIFLYRHLEQKLPHPTEHLAQKMRRILKESKHSITAY